MSILTWRGARQYMGHGHTSSVEPDQNRHFPRLFSPLRIGPTTIGNRIVSSGHDTVMAVDGKVSDQLIAYQEARAAGGAGLIVIQVAGIHPSARYSSHVLMADDDSCVPGLRPAGRRRARPRRDDLPAALPRRAGADGVRRRHAPGGLRAVSGAERAVPRDAAGDAGRR